MEKILKKSEKVPARPFLRSKMSSYDKKLNHEIIIRLPRRFLLFDVVDSIYQYAITGHERMILKK
jgi:hypothetical protein